MVLYVMSAIFVTAVLYCYRVVSLLEVLYASTVRDALFLSAVNISVLVVEVINTENAIYTVILLCVSSGLYIIRSGCVFRSLQFKIVMSGMIMDSARQLLSLYSDKVTQKCSSYSSLKVKPIHVL